MMGSSTWRVEQWQHRGPLGDLSVGKLESVGSRGVLLIQRVVRSTYSDNGGQVLVGKVPGPPLYPWSVLEWSWKGPSGRQTKDGLPDSYLNSEQ